MDSRPRILFIDDEKNILDGYKRNLRHKRAQWEMYFANHVSSAKKLLSEQAIDVIVTDIKMPGKNGFEFFHDLKENKQWKNSEIIMVTGLDDDDMKPIALNLGAFDLLKKPVITVDLITKIEQALENLKSRL